MVHDNPLNLYTGPDSLKHYFDPDSAPPLPLVELPPHLNPYHQDGVRIYAKMMTCHPANNVKAMPVEAMNLLAKEVIPGKTKTVIEYSSGSTVISMSMIGRVFHGINDTHAYLSNKTSQAKLRLMQFFGLKVTLFGGPVQPEPSDLRGGIRRACTQAQDSESIINPNQYENDANWESHVRWTAPQIHRQLPEITLICAGMGTSGTMTGVGKYFQNHKPSVFRLGVCIAPGELVPGPREYVLLAPVEFPWKDAVDHVEHIGTHDSYSLSLTLCRNGLLCGPSSGFNLQGLFNFLAKRKAEDTLAGLRGEDGIVHAVFLCCDLPYQYIGEYFDKLEPENFPPITNEHLTTVDLYRYEDAWELPPPSIFPLPPTTLVLDFRTAPDFQSWHLPTALHIPLTTLHPDSPSPFTTPTLLAAQWSELDALFSQSFLRSHFAQRRLLCLCYHGDTSRVATSVLRQKGFEAESVGGGARALVEFKSLRSVLAVKVVDAMELGLTVEVDSSAGVGEKVDEKVNEKADSVLEESDRASDSDGSEKGVDRSRR